MNPMLRGVLCAGLAAALPAWAGDDVQALALQTASNISNVSLQLGAHQKGYNEIAARRAELIAALERAAAGARLQVEREIGVFKHTGGEAMVQLMDQLRADTATATAAPAQLDAVQEQARKELAAAQPAASSTEQLDAAAKSLAALAKPQDHKARAQFLLSYARDVHDDLKALDQKGKDSMQNGDAAAGASQALQLEKTAAAQAAPANK